MNPQQRPDDPVNHVVLLVFENHTFDQMLGCFQLVYSDLVGVDPKHPGANRVDGTEFKQADRSSSSAGCPTTSPSAWPRR